VGQVLDEAADAALVLEHVAACFAALVGQLDLDAGVEEREFAQAARQHLVLELDVGEDLRRRAEADAGSVTLRRLHFPERVQRFAEGVLLLPVVAVAPDVHPQVLGQRVHHGNTHAMQAAGHLVAVVVELTAGMQHGHDDLGRRDVLFLVDVGGDAAPVVGDGHRAIVEQGDDDVIAVAGQRLVDGIVDYLEHHVVQAGAIVHIADVHARPLAHGLQAAKHGDLAGIVGALVAWLLFVGHGFATASRFAAGQSVEGIRELSV